MGFIEADHVPVFGEDVFLPVGKQAVGGDDHVAGAGGVDGGVAVALVVEHGYAQRRGEAGEFFLPVHDHRGRGHNKGCAFRGLVEDEGYGLNCLSESHVIGKAGPGTPVREADHPAEAFHLVVAQRGVEVCGHFRFEPGGFGDAFLQIGDALVGFDVHLAGVYKFREGPDVEPGDLHPVLA